MLLYALLCIASGACAQDKIDNLDGSRMIAAETRIRTSDSSHHQDTPRLHGSYAATGVISNANGIKSYTFNNAFKGSLATKNVTLNLAGSWIYGEASNILANNDFTSSLDVNLYERPAHFYYWGLADYTSSYSLGITRQEQAGAGAGYNLVDKKKATLNVSDGILYEDGDLYDSLYGGPNGSVYQRDRYETVRNSFRVYGHWVIYDKVTLDGTWYFQSALADSRDYIMKANATASVKLKSWLNFTTSYVFNRFTRTHTENTLLTFGLTVAR
jgi:hypothetical protein